jgi:hypothetical protein
MTAEQLRTVRDATPFRPFTIHLADGRSLPVPHRDFLSMTPGGRTVIVYRGGEAMSIVDIMLVTELSVDAPAGQ